MANLSLTGGEEEFGWRITGLGSAFNQANGYVEAGITRYQFTQSSHSISGVVDSVRAPSSGGSTSTTRRYVSYDPGTYDFWGYTLVQDGTYWPAGSSSAPSVATFCPTVGAGERATTDAGAREPASPGRGEAAMDFRKPHPRPIATARSLGRPDDGPNASYGERCDQRSNSSAEAASAAPSNSAAIVHELPPNFAFFFNLAFSDLLALCR